MTVGPKDVISILRHMNAQKMTQSQVNSVYLQLMQICTQDLTEDDKTAINNLLVGIDTEGDIKNFSKEVREWVESSDGLFKADDILRSLHLNSKKYHKNLSTVLNRMAKENPPLIEKVKDRGGAWRKVERDYEVMDIRGASTDPLNVNFILGIENFVRIYPKNIMLLSGVANSGKTGAALEMAWLNRNLYDVPLRFISSEANNQEIRERIELMPPDLRPLEAWEKKIMFMEPQVGADQYPNLINPNGFNIIDYLDVDSEAYNVKQIIKSFHQKLDKGVLLLLLQQHPNKDYAWGGQAVEHVPRLVLRMDRGKMTMKKVKAFRGVTNPDGYYRTFKLVNSWKFLPDSDWYPPEYKVERERYGRAV